MARPEKLPRGITFRRGKYRVRMSYLGVQYEIGQFDRRQDAEKALEIAKEQKAMGVFVPPAKLKQQRKAQRQVEEAQAVKDARTVRDLGEAWLAWLEE